MLSSSWTRLLTCPFVQVVGCGQKTVEVSQLLLALGCSAVLGMVVDMPLVCKRQGLGQTVKKTVVPQLLSSDKVVDVPGVRVVQILRCKCGGDCRLPQVQLVEKSSRFRTGCWTRSLTCPLLSTTGYCTGASIQLIACLRGHSSCATQTTGAVLGYG